MSFTKVNYITNETVITAKNLNDIQDELIEAQDAILAARYQVGDIFTTTREGNPSVLLGYGEWEQIKDKFLLAAGDSYIAGTTGGEAAHTLTVDEMPSHNHTAFGGSGGIQTDGTTVQFGYEGSTKRDLRNDTIKSTGGSQPHNNMPPYFAVYMWLRTA